MSTVNFKASGSPSSSPPTTSTTRVAGTKRKVRDAAERALGSPEEKRCPQPSPPKLPIKRPFRHLLAYYGIDFDRGEGDEGLKSLLLSVEEKLKGQTPAVMISVRREVRSLIDNEPRVRDCTIGVFAHYTLDFAREQHEDELLLDQLYQLEWLLSSPQSDFTKESKDTARSWVSQVLQEVEKTYLAEIGLLLHHVMKKQEALPEAGTRYAPLLNARIQNLLGNQLTEESLTAFLHELVDVLLLPGRVVNVGGARAMKTLLCTTRAGCFEEYYRYQLAVFCQDLIENAVFCEQIKKLPLPEALHPEVAALMRQELGLSDADLLDPQRVIEATMLSSLRPFRQNKVGNCYVIGPLQSLSYQYPQRVFKLFFDVFTSLILPREQGMQPVDLLAVLHREAHPETPLTLQELLFRACEYLCINQARSRHQLFTNWLLDLMDFSVFDGPLPFDQFVVTVKQKLTEHIYFFDTMQSDHLLKIVWTDGENAQAIESPEKLRLLLIECLENLSASEPELAPHLQQLRTFLRSPGSAPWTVQCFQSERLPGQGHFEEFYGLVGCSFRKERVQINEDLFATVSALALRPEQEPLLVGVPEHGFIMHPRSLAPYRDALLEHYQSLIIERGQSLLGKPLPLHLREKITDLLQCETVQPDDESLEDFCVRIEPFARQTDQLEMFRVLVNEAVRLVPLDELGDVLSTSFGNHPGAAEAVQNHFSADSPQISPHECARFLRNRFGIDQHAAKRALWAARELPESWEIGDLFWSDREGDYGPSVSAYVTFDVLAQAPALLFRGLDRVWFESPSFLDREIEIFIPFPS